jgi:hypothetical protein
MGYVSGVGVKVGGRVELLNHGHLFVLALDILTAGVALIEDLECGDDSHRGHNEYNHKQDKKDSITDGDIADFDHHVLHQY